MGLSLGLALAAGGLAAADPTNVAGPVPRTPPSTKLVVPPQWKVEAEARDYNFEALPLSEVTLHLQDQCKHQFDVLMPESLAPAAAPPGGPPPETMNPGDIAIKLRLKNVSIIEVFQAMNMLFEIDGKPVRWELVMNGHRPVAMLRALEPEPLAAAPAGGGGADPRAVSRSVVFVGDLIGEPNSGGMKPNTLCEILEETVRSTFPTSNTHRIQFHRAAELLVLSGTDEELRFMKDVLQALKEKSSLHQKQGLAPAPAKEPPPKK